VIGQLLRKRERFAHQAATALAQRVIKALNMIGLPALFSHRTMTLGAQNCRVRFPKIGVTDRTLPIHGWQGLPQLPRGGGITLAQRDPNNFARVAIESQPQPALLLLAADERPQFVTLDG
jgi:hypothetical protein